MGGNFDYIEVKDMDREKIAQVWAHQVEQSRYEDGRSYSGQIGMLSEEIGGWHDLGLDYSAAQEWLSDNHNKWEPALAVSYYAQPKPEINVKALAKISVHQKSIADLVESYKKAYTDMTDAFKSAKSNMVGCKTCNSKLNRTYLKPMPSHSSYNLERGVQNLGTQGYFCPVCKSSLQTDSQIERLRKIVAKIQPHLDKIKELSAVKREFVKDPNQKHWLIGGWCPS